MNRWYTWVVFATCFFASEMAEAQTAPMIWWESGTVKFRQANSGATGDPIPANADFCNENGCSKGGVVLSAARNEFEPFQIFIAAPAAADLAQVDLTLTDLKDSQGNTIAAADPSGKPKNLVVYREHYLSIDATKLSSVEGKPGLWPDGLVPKVDEYFGETRRMPGETAPAFPFNVPADRKQGIWIDVYVPSGTPAGLYTGSIQVTVGGIVKGVIPVKLTVQEFDLPSIPSLKSAYAVGISELTIGHFGVGAGSLSQNQVSEIHCLYTKEMLLHKVSNENIIWPKPAWNAALGRIDWSLPSIATTCNERYPEFLTGNNPNLLPNGKLPGAKLTRVRMRDGTGLGNVNKETVAYYQNYLQYFSDKGWKDRLFYYLWDEPAYPMVSGVRRCDRTWSGTVNTAWQSLYNKSKFFKDNGIDIPIMVTTNRQASEDCLKNFIGEPNWTRYLDIWTVGIGAMHGKPNHGFPFNTNLRGTYESIITPGKELWWYQACDSHGCGESQTGFPSPMADYPAIYNRMYQWLGYNYQIGYASPGPGTELYFETVYAYQFPTNDPWKNISYFSGNGDGTFFYPGRPDKIGGTKHIPISSIRMKLLREGIEDYDYLTLVEKKKNNEGIDGKEWIKNNVLIPYLAAVDPVDGTNKFISYNWNRNPGSPVSLTGLFGARQKLAGELIPASGSFKLTSSPTFPVAPGGASSSTVTISSINRFSAAVSLACSTSYPGVTCQMTPTSVAPTPDGSAIATLTVTPQAAAPLGTYSVMVTAVSGSLSDRNLLSQVVVGGDTFDSPASTNLGGLWNEYLPNLEIFSNQIRNTDVGNKAAVYTRPVGPDQDISVDCKMTAANNACGLMARWSNANNFYRVRLDIGQGNIVIMKTVNNVSTTLGSAARPMVANQYYRLRFVVAGASLAVYFGNETTPAISVTDGSLVGGNYAGIRAYSAAAYTTWFNNFNVSAVYSDTFDRADNSSLGLGWNEYMTAFTVRNNQIWNADGLGQEAQWTRLIGPNQQVSVDCGVTVSASMCALMGRWSDANNYYSARLDVGAGNIVLLKKINGVFTSIGTAVRPLQYGQLYRMRLVLQGSAITVYFAGETTPAISVSDASLPAGNYAGIRSYSSAAYTTYLDNFKATVP